MNFYEAALKTFPELTNTITNAQINQICALHNIAKPYHIKNAQNRVRWGVYHFDAPADMLNSDYEAPEVVVETTEQIKSRIQDTYVSLDILVRAVSANAVNSLVVSGGAGIGKSHTVNEILSDELGEENYVFHRGYLKATHLFRMLWENRQAGQTIVLDDVDMWSDEQTLNMLKAALELKATRRIGWGSEKEFLDSDGEIIPRYFDYEGSVIFLTNEDIYGLIGNNNKNAPHLKAIESRSLVLDMKVKTKQEYLAVIGMKIDEGLLSSKGFADEEQTEIMEFIETNIDRLRDMSLRIVEKIASLYRIHPDDWQTLVRGVCFR